MKPNFKYLFALAIAIPIVSHAQFTGGTNDGFGFGVFCGSDLNGTAAPAIALNAISGPGAFCSNNEEGYSVSLSVGIANSYLWSGPPSSILTVTSTTLTSGVSNYLFASTSGTISVTATNGCTSATASLPVTATACGNFTGGSNDGFADAAFCGNDLNGTVAPAIALNAISGPGAFCSSNEEGYSVLLSAGIANSYLWSGPPGAVLTATSTAFTTGVSNYLFASTSGTISVTVANSCTSAIASLPVTATACGNFLGGSNDGFADAAFCGNDLNGTVAPAIALNAISGPGAFCSNNTEGYSASLSAGITNSFQWTGPPGTVITQSSNTLTAGIINFLFATTSGNITVSVVNSCGTATATLPVTATTCGNFLGGNDDGFADAVFCGNDLNGTVATAITFNAISGPGAFCANNTEGYSVSLAAGTTNSFQWTGPTGTVITQSSNTLTSSVVNFLFAAANGTISVTAANSCGTTTTTLPVTATTCGNFLGAKDDGFAFGLFCGNDLNGTTGTLTLNAISGPGAFCNNNTEGYSVSLSSGISTSFTWSSPPGTVITQTSNTITSSVINFLFASTNGTISVTAVNNCSTATASLPVTATACGNFLGGNDDGFALGKVVNVPLPIELISFNAIGNKNEIDLYWATASELNNAYFTVEKSIPGQEFQWVGTVKGAGTSHQTNQYLLIDKYPFSGLTYYRLKQTDFDGNSVYSEVISIEFTPSSATDFEIYPNPTQSSAFNLMFGPSWEGKEGTMQISDLTGRSLINTNMTGQPVVQVTFDRQVLKPGLYLIVIYLDDRKLVKKLVVQ